jgi:hypothetical protein
MPRAKVEGSIRCIRDWLEDRYDQESGWGLRLEATSEEVVCAVNVSYCAHATL